MEKLYGIIQKLTAAPGVSGFEHASFGAMREYLESTGMFDEIYTTPVSSVCAIMRCGRENAELVMCDAHLDTVGFVVTEICEGGFLRIAPVGGIAPKILQASVVYIYGKETITGVFGSKPPHLQAPGEAEKKTEVTDLFIDTGFSAEKLKEIIRVGTPVGFRGNTEKLIGTRIVGTYLDDRLCAAAILRGLMMLDKTKLTKDIAFTFTAREETGAGGVMTVAYGLNPEYAIVSDVTNAFVPGAHKSREGVKVGKGVDICYSPKTSRRLTGRAVETARKNGVDYQLSASGGYTGTNAEDITVTRGGIPSVLFSIPLKNMHTASEIADLKDVYGAARLVSLMLCGG
ncbi:MAG: M20/M25/M40 family metallo-hydrolase [Clostridia bacterium]|nr:M20/M25/M40 family metallo-hydrolase [Clostridia bacterium]